MARALEGRTLAAIGNSDGGRLADGRPGRPPLLGRIDKAWAAFRESYAGLSDSRLTEPGVTGPWSVRDILAHVTTWEEEALKHLPLILEGGRPPRYVRYGGIDAFNALMMEQKRDLSLPEVLRQLDDTHHRLIDFVERAPEPLSARFRRRLRLDTYGHYPLHGVVIREWRKQRTEPAASRTPRRGMTDQGQGTKP
jgi:DinB superfamily